MTDSEPTTEQSQNGRSARAEAFGAAPGIARITVVAWVRTAEWTVGSTARAGRRVARAVLSGESVPDLIDDARSGLRGLLGVSDIEDRIAGLMSGKASPSERTALREQGAELLRRSSEVEPDEVAHPAYARILSELAPDEARILRLMEESGPQATVDVRTWRPLDVGSRVVAPGLSMIGRHAGVRHADRIPAYLNNLNRLGLVWFTREPVESRSAYQVLEAQPDVIEAIKQAGRARVVHRSIQLTPFGRDFCETALPEDAGPTTGEFEALAAADADG
jgi:hypothetical protein